MFVLVEIACLLRLPFIGCRFSAAFHNLMLSTLQLSMQFLCVGFTAIEPCHAALDKLKVGVHRNLVDGALVYTVKVGIIKNNFVRQMALLKPH
jgi:hypothetical protein